MKKVFKIIGIIVILILIVALGGLIYLQSAFPKVSAAKNIKVEITAERIARGKYLANHVNNCVDCHSTRNWEYYSGPTIDGTDGKGGERFDEAIGIPGTLYSSNITPAGIGDWTDGELIRTITTGVTKNGKALFPLMPYLSFGKMCEEDVYAVVAYIRSLSPIQNKVPDRSLNFPMNMIVRTIPQDATPMHRPDTTDIVAYGKYMTTIAGCADCHTPADKGKPLPGMDFAGGFEFQFPDGSLVRSANITPDNETGIGGWNKDFFVKRFKTYDTPEAHKILFEKGKNTMMPWTKYAGMTEQDLGAIYSYLRTLTPVNHPMQRFDMKKN